MLCTCSRCGIQREGDEMCLTPDQQILCFHPARGEDCYQIVLDGGDG